MIDHDTHNICAMNDTLNTYDLQKFAQLTNHLLKLKNGWLNTLKNKTLGLIM